MHLFGFPNSDKEIVERSISIPKGLSFLAFHDFDAEVKGLDVVPREDWPRVKTLFPVYRLMLGMWGVMVLLCVASVWMWYKGTLFNSPWMLRALVFSVLCPQIANQAGWVAAEMGRYPWIVQDLLRISDGLSKAVTEGHVLGSIIMFGCVYSFLLVMFLYLLNEKIKAGPSDEDLQTPYHGLSQLVGENGND